MGRSASTAQFPPMQQQALQNYMQVFRRLDTDGDSRVQV